MVTQSFTSVRKNFAETIDQVQDDQAPIFITRNGEAAAVLVSVDEYSALQETAYLLASPTNARRLLEAIEQLESGGGTERELIE